MKRILLPTDFSENAYSAIRYAVQLFKDNVCTFYLLHTYTPVIYNAEYIVHSPGQIGLGDEYQINAIEQLDELQHRIIKEFNNPGHTFINHTAFNLLIPEILETVKNEDIDIIVMSTQGATGAKEIVLGTNTVHAIRKAKCPVIAVPSNYGYKPPKAILFPTDYELDYQKKQLRELLHIATLHNSQINVLHVTIPDGLNMVKKANQKKLKKILASVTSLFHDVPDQGVIDAINNFQSGRGTDLLAMVQNKHTFFERLFVEPIIRKIGFHITVPLMVIPQLD